MGVAKQLSKPIPYSFDPEDIGVLTTPVAPQGPECKVGMQSAGNPPRHQAVCVPIGTSHHRTLYRCPVCGTVCFGEGAYARP